MSDAITNFGIGDWLNVVLDGTTTTDLIVKKWKEFMNEKLGIGVVGLSGNAESYCTNVTVGNSYTFGSGNFYLNGTSFVIQDTPKLKLAQQIKFLYDVSSDNDKTILDAWNVFIETKRLISKICENSKT